MNATVDFLTAKELRDAGFPQPEPNVCQFWYRLIFKGGTREQTLRCICLDYGQGITLQAIKQAWDYPGNARVDKDCTFAPTAIEIIEQMPTGTRIQNEPIGIWKVTFPITENYPDFREDTCPHKASAMAYLAWKKGQQ